MNFWNLVYRAAEYGIILPGIFLCIIPVADWLIIPQRKLYPVLLPCMVAVCFVLAWMDSSGSYYTNIFFFPLLGICLIAYFLTVKLEKLKLLYMFLCATAALSFGCIMNYYIIARIDPHSNIHDDSVPGLIIQYAVSLLIMSVLLRMRHKYRWLFENFNTTLFWRIAWMIPAIISFCNIYMIPIDYANIRVGRIFQIAMVIEGVLFLFFMLFQSLLYIIAVTTSRKIEADSTALMYQLQADQYEKMQAYLDETRRIRHDFKHTIAVLNELSQTGQYEKLQEYISNYSSEISNVQAPATYCDNPVVNATIHYYIDIAQSYGIRTKLQVVIPKEIRRTLRIREGDPLEIYTDREGEVILKKYSMIGDIGQFAKQYADALSQTTGYLVMVTDRDMVIAASSGVKKDMVGKHISRELEKAALDRKIILTDSSKKEYCRVADDMEGDYIEAIAPIICNGDVAGSIVFLNKNTERKFGETEQKMIAVAASFLGKQMEG